MNRTRCRGRPRLRRPADARREVLLARSPQFPQPRSGTLSLSNTMISLISDAPPSAAPTPSWPSPEQMQTASSVAERGRPGQRLAPAARRADGAQSLIVAFMPGPRPTCPPRLGLERVRLAPPAARHAATAEVRAGLVVSTRRLVPGDRQRRTAEKTGGSGTQTARPSLCHQDGGSHKRSPSNRLFTVACFESPRSQRAREPGQRSITRLTLDPGHAHAGGRLAPWHLHDASSGAGSRHGCRPADWYLAGWGGTWPGGARWCDRQLSLCGAPLHQQWPPGVEAGAAGGRQSELPVLEPQLKVFTFLKMVITGHNHGRGRPPNPRSRFVARLTVRLQRVRNRRARVAPPTISPGAAPAPPRKRRGEAQPVALRPPAGPRCRRPLRLRLLLLCHLSRPSPRGHSHPRPDR